MRREKREGRRGEERNESSSSRVQPLTSPVVRARITRRPAPSIFLGGFLLHECWFSMLVLNVGPRA